MQLTLSLCAAMCNGVQRPLSSVVVQGGQKVIPYWNFVTTFLPIVMKELCLMVETLTQGFETTASLHERRTKGGEICIQYCMVRAVNRDLCL